jgi:uncharacterized protein
MASLVTRMMEKGIISPPLHLKTNIHYEVIMGSEAYGMTSESSDIDIYGFSIPHKETIFPHLAGYIQGFGTQSQGFEQYQQHHVKYDNNKEYDICIYSIIKYFHLCMMNNPNMIDSLFVPRRCIIFSTQVGEHIRERRKEFLHKGSWHKFRGYSYSQINKMQVKNPEPGSKRYNMVQKYGYDLKFASHVVRLLNEVEQIMIEKDLDLERNREQLKSIRRGEWTKDQIIKYFEKKELELESIYTNSKLPYKPNEERIKQILLECLEMHFGSLQSVFPVEKNMIGLISEISATLEKYR